MVTCLATPTGSSQPRPVETGRRVEVFFDNECPLCRREINLLRWVDRKHRIQFTDITTAAFDPAEFGMTRDDFMSEIQGRLPDGSFITGVEVFRQLYGAVGFQWLVPLTRIPGVSHLMDFGYRVFAKNRLKFTGRCTNAGPLPTGKTKPNT
jgi:predicted DCC family thiol-disulfide oxidoreductase YuxK